MPITLSGIVTAGGAVVVAGDDIFQTIEAAVAAGGGALAETEAVVKGLLANAKFSADLTTAVNAIKAL